VIKFSTWSIRTKLTLGLASCAAVMVAIGLIGEAGERAINANTLEIYQGDLIPILDITQVRQGIHADVEAIQRMLLTGDAHAVEKARETLVQNAASADAAWSDYYVTITDSEEKAEADALIISRKALASRNQNVINRASKDLLDARQSFEDPAYQAAVRSTNERISTLYARNKAQALSSYASSTLAYRRTALSTWASIALGFTIAAALLVALLRNISRPLREAVQLADRIAAGELKHDVQPHRDDEIGALMGALGRMDEQLTAIVSGVRDGAQAVSAASTQMALGNDDLSRRTQSQATSLEETAAVVEEMTGSVRHNAERATHAALLASTASSRAQSGQYVIADTVEAMSAIAASGQRIGEITDIIENLAFQTNILSLNAAVEAAHAGDAGRAFAVVASEVRNLASRSASAAKAIRSLTDEVSETISTGVSLVGISAEALDDLLQQTLAVSSVARDIASASGEQSLGIGQVNTTLAVLDDTTQHTAALVEEAATASHALQGQAVALLERVNFFRIRPGGLDAEQLIVDAQPSTRMAVW
jgi:methyl-accepting chemotaxis protein